MANPIVPKHSATPGKVPTTTDLLLGEIAVNTYDGKMYMEKDDGSPSIVQIGGDLADTDIKSLRAASRTNYAYNDAYEVCIYDTAKDSDGGAWRQKVKALSYYSETLSTSTRGARRDVPSKMQIFAAGANLYAGSGIQINDADDPLTPMWMQVLYVSNGLLNDPVSAPTSIDAAEGLIVVCPAGGGTSPMIWDLTTDSGVKLNGNSTGTFNGNIALRHTQAGYATGSAWGLTGFPVASANDASIGVRSTAMVAPNRLGLRYPVVAFAHTFAGITVVDFEAKAIYNSTETSAAKGVCIRDGLIFWHDGATYYSCPIPTATGFTAKKTTYTTFNGGYAPTGYCEPTVLARNGTAGYDRSGGAELVKYNYADQTRNLYAGVSALVNTGWRGKGCVLALAESSANTANVPAATEKLTNPTCDVDATGWSATNATLSSVNGRLRVTGTNTSYPSAYQTLTTIVGQRYKITFTGKGISTGQTAASVTVSSNTNLYGGPYVILGEYFQYSSYTKYFVATSTTTYIHFGITGLADYTGVWADYDDLSVTAVSVDDYSGRGNYPTVVGTVTRSAVATGADVAAYGFASSPGNTKYLSVPLTSAWDIEAGQSFCFMGWVKPGDISGSSAPVLYMQSAMPASYFDGITCICLDVFSYWRLFLTHGGARVQTNGGAGTSNTWHHWAITRSGSTITVYINGNAAITVTDGAAFKWGAGPNALLMLGAANYNGTFNTGGVANSATLQRFHIGDALTAAEIAQIYADEVPLFQANAKCLLPSNNVQSVARDSDQNKIFLGTDAGTAIHTGLLRTTLQLSTAPLSGSNNHKYVAAQSGLYAIGTAAGVDYFAPAIPLRDTLLRRDLSPIFLGQQITGTGGVTGQMLYDAGGSLQETIGLKWDTAAKRLTAADPTYSFGWTNLGIRSPDGQSLAIEAAGNPLITADGMASPMLMQIINGALQKLFAVSDRDNIILNLLGGDGSTAFQVLSNGNTLQTGNQILPFREVRAATTISEKDFTLNCVGTFTVTVPTMPWGMVFNIKNSGSGLITVSGSIDGQASWALFSGDNICIQSTGKGYIII